MLTCQTEVWSRLPEYIVSDVDALLPWSTTMTTLTKKKAVSFRLFSPTNYARVNLKWTYLGWVHAVEHRNQVYFAISRKWSTIYHTLLGDAHRHRWWSKLQVVSNKLWPICFKESNRNPNFCMIWINFRWFCSHWVSWILFLQTDKFALMCSGCDCFFAALTTRRRNERIPGKC